MTVENYLGIMPLQEAFPEGVEFVTHLVYDALLESGERGKYALDVLSHKAQEGANYHFLTVSDGQIFLGVSSVDTNKFATLHVGRVPAELSNRLTGNVGIDLSKNGHNIDELMGYNSGQ